MRDDQYLKLQELEEKLVPVVLQEADPDNWPGKDIIPKDLTKDDRGDRYWCKKNAAATLTLLNKVISLVERPTRGLPGLTPEVEDNGEEEISLDKEINRHERKAAKLLEEFQNRTSH